MRGVIAFLIIGLIVLSGCAGIGGNITGNAVTDDGIPIPENMKEREIAILILTKKVVEPVGLPVFVPVLGKEGESSGEIGPRIAAEGTDFDDIYWGIQVFLPGLEANESSQKEFEDMAKDTVNNIYMNGGGEDLSKRADFGLIVEKFLLTDARLEQLKDEKYPIAKDAISRYKQFAKVWPNLRKMATKE